MIRILLIEQDSTKQKKLAQYLQSCEEFRVSSTQFEDEAADEMEYENFDLILYFYSEKSDPTALFSDNFSSPVLMLVFGSIKKDIFGFLPEKSKIKISYLPDFGKDYAELSEQIKKSYTIYCIENTVLNNTERYREFFNEAPLPCAIFNSEGRILNANKKWTKYLGYEKEDLLNKNILDLIKEEYVEDIKKCLHNSLKYVKNNSGTETVLIKKGGEFLSALLFCSGISDNSDKTDKILCSLADITLYNASKKNLNYKSRLFDAVGSSLSYLLNTKSVNEDLSQILATTGIAIGASRVSIYFKGKNEQDSNLFVKKSSWTSREIADFPQNSVVQDFLNLKEKQDPGSLQKPAEFFDDDADAKTGDLLRTCRTKSLLCIPVEFDRNKTALITIEDCLERKKRSMEETDALANTAKLIGMILALKNIRLKNLNILNSSPDLICVFDRKNRLVYANSSAEKIFDLQKKSFCTLDISDLFQKDNLKKISWQIKGSLEIKGPVKGDYSLYCNGKNHLINLVIYPLKGESDSDEIKNVILFGRDITDREEFEKRLLLTQFAVESSPDSVYYTDKKGNIIYANRAACEQRGYSKGELLKKTVRDINPLCSPEKWIKHWEDLKTKKTLQYETIHKRSNGSAFEVEVVKNYLNICGEELSCSYARDITKRRLNEDKIIFSLKAKYSPPQAAKKEDDIPCHMIID